MRNKIIEKLNNKEEDYEKKDEQRVATIQLDKRIKITFSLMGKNYTVQTRYLSDWLKEVCNVGG